MGNAGICLTCGIAPVEEEKEECVNCKPGEKKESGVEGRESSDSD